MCLGVFPAIMSVHNMCTLTSEPEESVGATRTGVRDSCEPSSGCWGLNLGSVE